MEKDKLKEYLKIVEDMEKNNYLEEQMIDQLTRKVREIDNIPDEPKPFRAFNIGKPVKRNVIRKRSLFFANLYSGNTIRKRTEPIVEVILNFGIGAVVGIVILTLFLNFLPTILSAFLGGLAFSMLYVGSFCREQRNYDNEYNEEESKAVEEYDIQLSDYNKKLSEYNVARIKYENDYSDMLIRARNEREILKYNIQKIKQKQGKSKETLSKIYSENIIFPKYRNFSMVSSIYEYICSGRCEDLEGRDGAYNILEMEIRLDRIIMKLDDINANLKRVHQYQYMLYEAVQETNRRMSIISNRLYEQCQTLDSLNKKIDKNSTLFYEKFCSSLSSIEETSGLTAYYAERASKELEYMNRMDYLMGRNNGVYGNRPPSY